MLKILAGAQLKPVFGGFEIQLKFIKFGLYKRNFMHDSQRCPLTLCLIPVDEDNRISLAENEVPSGTMYVSFLF